MKHLRSLSAIVVAILAAFGGSIAFIALFPFFDVVGKLLVGLLAIMVACIAVVAIGEVHHRLQIRKLQRQHYVLPHDISAVVSDGQLRNILAEIEEARRPLALPAPSITMVSEEKPTATELDVLAALAKGESQRQVAHKCGLSQTKVSEIKRKWEAHLATMV